MRRLLSAISVGALVAVLAAGAARAEDRCGRLQTESFALVEDAPTRIGKAEAVAAPDDKTVPPYCRVTAVVGGSIGIEMRMPLAGWNGDFYKHGCAGFCGVILGPACDSALRKGFACLLSDMGHSGTMLDGRWAYDDMPAKIDFGFRATHLSTLAGKALTAAFYGRPPDKSFYEGCSTGGRQGMLLAEQFPEDFDGVVAGAPVIDETGASLQLMWSVRANLDADGAPILRPSQLAAIHAEALRQCDDADGLADGVIGDPGRCRVDLAPLICSSAESDLCLTPPQAEVVRKIYDGPRARDGRPLYTGGAKPGSELNWSPAYIGEAGAPPVYAGFVGDFFRYMAFPADPGPSWTVKDFDAERAAPRLRMMEKIYGASNPDLRAFAALGHKLLIFQGWSDQSVVPGNIVDYYETAARVAGGIAELQRSARLFMIPGMNHCYGGPSADAVDYLAAMQDWVHRGIAPERLIGAHLKAPAAVPMVYHFPIAGDDAAFTRPLFPYPARARYRGRGDPADASSFEADPAP